MNKRPTLWQIRRLEKTQVRLKENARTFCLKRKCVSGKTQVRFLPGRKKEKMSTGNTWKFSLGMFGYLIENE